MSTLPPLVAIQLRAVTSLRTGGNLFTYPIDVFESFSTFTAERRGSATPQTQGFLGARILAARIRNSPAFDVLLHDGNVVDAADFFDDLHEKRCSVDILVS